MIIIIRT